jgi:acetyl-CoA C-acetyltransferase
MAREIVVLAANRSPIGSFGGSLSSLEPADLAALVIRDTIIRSGIPAKDFAYVTVGNCIPTEVRYAYTPRLAAIQAGLPMESVAMQVNRLCSSGLQAIVSTSQGIMLGDYDYGIAGGVEVMSRAGYMAPAMRHGARMGDTKMVDMMVGVLTDPFGVGHMGITAENLAAKWNISREEQDQFALQSQKRAASAITAGYFQSQITSITIKTRKGELVFDTDEYVKTDATIEGLAKLKPAFKRDGGTVTAGNASGVNDGAAFLALAATDAVKKTHAKPLARLVTYALAGVPNHIMGEGPIPATKLALKKAGLKLEQMDVIESNEAFAAQAIAVSKGLGLDNDKTNPNGGAIALGHPVGCTGAYIATKALYELQRIQGTYCLVTMCVGGGQGLAVIFERL